MLLPHQSMELGGFERPIVSRSYAVDDFGNLVQSVTGEAEDFEEYTRAALVLSIAEPTNIHRCRSLSVE
ncbi:hypothetical protein R70006_06212 [Paraburkholderia domus]|uniref:hypothetical protein n=1 Tax=Paraburkholderia domus TaxID=2793075 RepID=UPI001911B833|nr:hypothetical protein [Paraburkholderia domus]MBK5052844.1 hypothetical protein [Burkholderia sp. R-70006]CAE6821330.1 hypothetical protein R70006_06212 [Paraburkholderia domus]